MTASLFLLTLQTAGAAVAPGTRVRLKLDEKQTWAGFDSLEALGIGRGDRIVGSLLSLSRDTLTIAPKTNAFAIIVPTTMVRKLEASKGRGGRAGKGAWIGLASGAGAGIAAALVACADGYCTEAEGNQDQTGFVAVVFGLGGGLVGAGIGAVVGSFITGENWEAVRLPDTRLGFTVRNGELRVILSLCPD